MDPDEPQPCPQCRVPISPEASICPQCRSGVLVDVCVAAPVADARVRYRLGRALRGLDERFPALAVLQDRLLRGNTTLLQGLTRALAQKVIDTLAAEGVGTRRADAGAALPAAKPTAVQAVRPRSMIAAAIAGAVILVAAGVAIPRARRAASTVPTSVPYSVPSAPALPPTQLAAVGLAATVRLGCGEQSGSGFLVAPDLVVTNAHVTCPDTRTVQVRTNGGRQLEGTVERVDEVIDLALVRLTEPVAEPLALGDAGTLAVGQRLTIVGSPVGMEFTVTQVGVGNLDRHGLGVAYLQLDGPVNPGNSGGPVLDDRGHVVGVVTRKLTGAEGIGFAVPINYLRAGVQPLVAATGPESAGFQRMAEAAQTESRDEAAKLASQGQRPGLVAAAAVGNEIFVRIAWPAAMDPGRTSFRFALWNGTDRICSFDGEVQSWVKIEGERGTSPLPPRIKTWLEANGFSANLYAGETSLRYDECPGDRLNGAIDIEMEGADPAASRVRFR